MTALKVFDIFKEYKGFKVGQTEFKIQKVNLLRNFNEFVLIEKSNLLKSMNETELGIEQDLLGTFIGVQMNQDFAIVTNYFDVNEN